jgi:hypothetical protein
MEKNKNRGSPTIGVVDGVYVKAIYVSSKTTLQRAWHCESRMQVWEN